MRFLRLLAISCLVVFSFVPAFPQNASPTESQSEKEKKQKELEKLVLEMIDQAVSDAPTLKLSQNRAIVYVLAGDLYWKFDEKRARELFRNAGSELILLNAESEKEKKETDDPYAMMFEFGGPRNEILPIIAKNDADLALELLVQTRSAKLTEAIAKSSQPNAKQSDGMFNFDPDNYRVRQEVSLEQRFAALAAEQNPEKAIKLIKESLAKGLSEQLMPLLQKVYQKDEKKAASLADDIVQKIVETDLSKKNSDMGIALRFLTEATNPNKPKTQGKKFFSFSDAQIKTIANKLFDTFIQPTASLEMTMALTSAIRSFEKVLPEKAALLKQKQTEAMKNLPPELKRFQQQEKLWNPNSTPEEILADLPKLNEYEKASAYQSLINKIAQIDDEARAKKLIDEIPDEKTRTNASEAYESAKINRAASDGKLDEAKKMIGNLSKKKTQIQKLVTLAMQFYKKGSKENLETAANLMKDAKGLANEYPEDEDELNDLMEIVKGYALIEPNEAFRIFDPIVDQINDFVQASAILSKYNKRNRSFKKGELLMTTNSFTWDGLLLFRYIIQIQMLGKADLQRMNTFSDKFQRSDARTIVKLFVAQGFLREDKKPKDDSDDSGGNQIFIEF
ncbi:MAG TPA: hypothetical protein PKY59_10010 [Pyrinomonadaceae bacterium]|nr:hypothetical protein [Pyrinomonadaceae bacterium]